MPDPNDTAPKKQANYRRIIDRMAEKAKITAHEKDTVFKNVMAIKATRQNE